MPTLGRISAVLLLTATAFAGNAGPVFQLPNQPTVYAIQRDTAGNVYLAGAVTAPGRKDLDAFVAKLSSDGRVLFFNTFGGTYSESANALAIASDGSIVTVGVTTSLDFPITSGPVAQNPNLPP